MSEEPTNEAESEVIVLGRAKSNAQQWLTWDEGSGWPTISFEMLAEYIKDDQRELRARRDQIIAAAPRFPETILDEETAQRATTFGKTINTYLKNARSDHDQRKAVFFAAGNVVDSNGHEMQDKVAGIKRVVEARLGAYQRAKTEAERRAREAARRAAEEEAERKRREAEEAERALAAPAATEVDLERAIDTAAAAEQAAADAVPVARAAEAKPAELSQVRSPYGALASLRRFWDFEGIDRATIDLEALRQHIPTDCLEKAVRSAVNAGTREIRGVAKIFENTRSQIR